MNDLFEDYWLQQPEFAGGDGGPHVAACAKELAQEAWDDGRRFLILGVIIRVDALHRRAMSEVKKYPEGSPARLAAAATATALGKLLVTLSEMQT